MKINNIFKQLIIILGVFYFLPLSSLAEVPELDAVQQKLAEAKKLDQSDLTNKSLTENLTKTLDFLEKIAQQKIANKALETRIKDAPNAISLVKKNLDQMRAEDNAAIKKDWSSLSIDSLNSELANIQKNLQATQTSLSEINGLLVEQRSAPEKAQSELTASLSRVQEINQTLADSNLSNVKREQLEAELALIGLQQEYNQMLLKGGSELASLYTSQLEEKTFSQQKLQKLQDELQSVLNEKNLKATKQQIKQFETLQDGGEVANPVVISQQKNNIKLSQDLIEQTTRLNELSKNNLRIKSVLENLQQTSRNIDEQISSLQGSLILSRVINKQKQSLPQNEMIKGLPKKIAELRVKIFDFTELRDNLFDSNRYIKELEKKAVTTFSENDKKQLSQIIQKRYALVSDILANLNKQLNLAINIELNQKQVSLISDSLQEKLQQQSFWVESNAPIDINWFVKFLPAVNEELKSIYEQFNFNNWQHNLLFSSIFIIFLVVIAMLILWKKNTIKERLAYINSKVNADLGDRQRYTPEAVFWTLILCLPSTLLFLSVLIFITFVCFDSPEIFWLWSVQMAGYWLFFAFMLAMLRPNGIAARHFNIPQHNVDLFLTVMKKSVWISALWINAPIFTHLEGGIANDVIGQVLTIFILIISFVVIGPRMRYAIRAYHSGSLKSQSSSQRILLQLVQIVSFVAPVVLIALIIFGYYYTALNLMAHLISSYFVFMFWIVIKNMIYRGFTVSAKDLAYRRLLEKRKKLQEEIEDKSSHDEFSIEIKDEELDLSKIQDQAIRIMDIMLFVGLIGLFYWVWSDLVAVAYYLEGVTLWKQTTVTEAGTVIESITLWNLLLAIIIIISTYALARNISGVLEVLIFSRVKLSQGTPYTITTLSIYFIIAVGAGTAFSTLGMSWSKLQWLFAALSVGLGFGLQEIFANFVSGLIILFERPIRIGDVVTIDDFSGTVSRIRIRSTTIVDFDQKEVIVPNKTFVTERITNWALTDSITRVLISVGVAYGSDLELVKRLLLQAAKDCKLVLKDPEPVVYFLTFGASTLDHELRVYVNNIGERNPAIDFLNRRIDKLFAEHDIEISFNQLDVFIKNTHSDEEIKLHTQKLS